MRGLMMAATLGLLAMTGCKGGNPELVKGAEELADKTCACKDMACLEGVQKDYEAWVAKNPVIESEEDAKKVASASNRLTECSAKLQAELAAPAGGAPAAPAGEAPAAPAEGGE